MTLFKLIVLRDISSLRGGTQHPKPSRRLLISLEKQHPPRMLAQVDLKPLVHLFLLILVVIGREPLQVTADQGVHEYHFSPI